MTEKQSNVTAQETQGVYSALVKRPPPKVVDESDATVSYVAGIRLAQALNEIFR